MKKVICFVYNTSQYLYNFRIKLMLEVASLGYHVVAIAPRDKYSDKIIAHGIDYYPINTIRNDDNIITDIQLIYNLYKLYKELNPIIIHHFTIKPVLYGSVAGRLANIPSIINSVTGLGVAFIRPSLKRWLLCIFYYISLKSKRVHVIFQNPEDRYFFVKRKLIKEYQAHLILSSGVDLNKFRAHNKKDSHNLEHCTFLFLSRLLYEKGIIELVSAIELLVQKNNKVKLIIAGEVDPDNPRSIPRDWLNKKSKSSVIDWLGFVEDVVELLSEVDVIVLPSYYGEGVPHSLIEAIAVGLPIITTDTPGCRLVVENNINGFLIPTKDINALFLAMEKLSYDKDLRKKFGNNSLLRAKEFDLEKINFQTIQLYKNDNK